MQNHELLSIAGIECAEGFIEDYNRIVQSKPNRYEITRKLIETLDLINRDKNPAVFCKYGNVEKLQKAQGIYTIKIKRQCNIRVLFSVEKDGTILLHAFEEIGGKRTTDYTHAIPTARRRLSDYKGGHK